MTQNGQPDRTKRIRLAIVGSGEDFPRLLLAHGKAWNGRWALILRPLSGEGVVVLIPPGGAAPRMWKVEGNGGDKGGARSDAPAMPTQEVSWEEATEALKRFQDRARLPKANPVVTRGSWTGFLRVCGENGRPTVNLQRRVVSYGVLHVVSAVNTWTWRFERAPKWFAASGATEGAGSRLLSWAIEGGHKGSVTLVAEACNLRDRTRRGAVDAEHAKLHPVKVPKDPKRDPTEAVKPPKPKKAPKPKTPKADKPKKAPKPKAEKAKKEPMTAAQKEAFKEKMRLAREAAQAKKPKTPKADKPKKAPKPKAEKKPKAKKNGNGGAKKNGNGNGGSKDKALMEAFTAAIKGAMAA